MVPNNPLIDTDQENPGQHQLDSNPAAVYPLITSGPTHYSTQQPLYCSTQYSHTEDDIHHNSCIISHTCITLILY